MSAGFNAFTLKVNPIVVGWKMSRPVLLVFLLLVLIITSQFEWKQPLVFDPDSSPTALSDKSQLALEGQEVVKEKIILLQEKKIQRLRELVRTLQQQLLACKGEKYIPNATVNVIELERQQTLGD